MPASTRRALKNALESIVPTLRKSRVRTPEGGFGLQGLADVFGPEELQAVLYGVFPFASSIAAVDRIGIITDAIFEGIANEELTAESLLDVLETKYQHFLKTPLRQFSLLTFLSISSYRDRPDTRTIDDATIHFEPSVPKHFDRSELDTALDRLNVPMQPRDWCSVIVDCRGRTPLEAANRALDALNFWRSLWCFASNYRVGIAYHSPVELPRNEFRIGPIHTIHEMDGRLASGAFHYETPFVSHDYPGRPKSLSKPEIARLERSEEILLRQLVLMKYGDGLKNVLREYVSILDMPSNEGGFIRLWKVLEALTGTEHADYDVLVKRASAVYKDRKLAKLLLEHLRNSRNLTTHDLSETADIRMCFQHALKFVHSMLFVHINNAGKFSSFKEAGEFLSHIASGRAQIERQTFLVREAREVENVRETIDLESDFQI
jgi:hypothetical protein